MATTNTQIPRIVQLADQLEEDIRQRGLKPGDAYLSTVDAARMLGGSANAANRALQVLAKRNLIDRRQGKGSTIAEPLPDSQVATLRRVHLLVHHNYLRTEGLMADGVVVGMQEALPVAQIQFNFLPAEDESDYVNQLISEALQSSQPEGFVLVRASLTTQRLMQASGMPTVVHGTLFPSIDGLAFIERDQAQIGRLLTERVLDGGCERVGLLMRSRMMAGDHVLLDAVQDLLTERQMPLNALRVRCMPSDADAAAVEATRLIEESDETIGFVCRNEPMAEAVASAATKAGVKNCPITVCDVYRKGAQPPRFTHAQSTLTPEEIGAHVGRMLSAQAEGARPDPPFEMIPVAVESPM